MDAPLSNVQAQSRWIAIPETEAKKHVLYGTGGWLLVFAAGLFLSGLKSLGDTHNLASAIGSEHPAVAFFKIAQWSQICLAIVVVWMMTAKATFFRVATTWLLLLTFPVLVMIAVARPLEGVGSLLSQSFLYWAISCSVWVTYLHRSKRVRVTFEHLVLGDEKRTAQNTVRSTSTEISRPSSLEAQTSRREITRAADHEESNTPREASSSTLIAGEEIHWAQALEEFEGPERKPGLWARAFVQAGGDDVQTKVIYLSARASELAQAHQTQLTEAAAQSQREREAQRLGAMTEEERAWELTPKADCPNCSTVIPFDSVTCPSCKAQFGPYSAWQLRLKAVTP
ncbi:hypothetical protein [Comamonas sp.]|uniref:hypothetical protein n=1 Tax=Comamonas sp. TaxID=34028 RepID=UPI00289D4B41|nr:hypothetical protein [Comamonas sp.]